MQGLPWWFASAVELPAFPARLFDFEAHEVSWEAALGSSGRPLVTPGDPLWEPLGCLSSGLVIDLAGRIAAGRESTPTAPCSLSNQPPKQRGRRLHSSLDSVRSLCDIRTSAALYKLPTTSMLDLRELSGISPLPFYQLSLLALLALC